MKKELLTIFISLFFFVANGSFHVSPAFGLQKGDVDGNGVVEFKDAIIGLQILTGEQTSSSRNRSADVNGDNKLGIPEVIFVLQGINGLRSINYSISGKVSAGASGLSEVDVSILGKTTTTDSSGNYTFSNLLPGSYTLTPSKIGYHFKPETITVTVTYENITEQNFEVPPDQAALHSPAGTIIYPLPIFEWDAVATATMYFFSLKTANGKSVAEQLLTATEANCASGIGKCAVSFKNALPAGAYNWEIQTRNNSANGPWSDKLEFTLSQPAQATLRKPTGIITNSKPNFEWQEVATATWYYIGVFNASIAPVFGQWYSTEDAKCTDVTGICAVTLPAAFPAGGYIWTIIPWNPTGYGPWSYPMTFTVPLPDQAILHAPSGIISDPKPTFEWDAVASATNYFIWLKTSSGIFVLDQWLTATEANCASGMGKCTVTVREPLLAGAYAWGIQTGGHSGLGPWSDKLEFIVPLSGTLSKPPSEQRMFMSPKGFISGPFLTFQWLKVPNATMYSLGVKDANGNSIYEKTVVDKDVCLGIYYPCIIAEDTNNLNLKEGETYTCWLQAANNSGLGPLNVEASRFTFIKYNPGQLTNTGGSLPSPSTSPATDWISSTQCNNGCYSSYTSCLRGCSFDSGGQEPGQCQTNCEVAKTGCMANCGTQ